MIDWLSDIRVRAAVLFSAGLGYLAVALLSWMPAAYRPHIFVVSDKLEHALAYLLLGAVSVLATRQIISPHRLALALVAYAGVLEFGQLLSPSRVFSVEDFMASAAGAIVGVSIAALAVRRLATR